MRFIPFASQYPFSASSVGSQPIKACASCSLGTSTSVAANTSSGIVVTGDGFNSTCTPCLWQSRTACHTVSYGISSCMTQTLADAISCSHACISSTLTHALAPGYTTMLFSPESATHIKALPVGSWLIFSPFVSTLALCREERSASPAASAPTAPIKAVCPPSLPAATA